MDNTINNTQYTIQYSAKEIVCVKEHRNLRPASIPWAVFPGYKCVMHRWGILIMWQLQLRCQGSQ